MKKALEEKKRKENEIREQEERKRQKALAEERDLKLKKALQDGIKDKKQIDKELFKPANLKIDPILAQKAKTPHVQISTKNFKEDFASKTAQNWTQKTTNS